MWTDDDVAGIVSSWIHAAIRSQDVVPADEGNLDALKYNLLHLLTDGRRFNYEPDQVTEIGAWEENEGVR